LDAIPAGTHAGKMDWRLGLCVRALSARARVHTPVLHPSPRPAKKMQEEGLVKTTKHWTGLTAMDTLSSSFSLPVKKIWPSHINSHSWDYYGVTTDY
jgi:hypothetical protein